MYTRYMHQVGKLVAGVRVTEENAARPLVLPHGDVLLDQGVATTLAAKGVAAARM